MAVGICLATNALFTLEFFEDYFGTVTVSEDVAIMYVNSASKSVENYLGYEFHRQTVTAEEHGATGDRRIVLDKQPLLSVTEVRYDGTVVSTDDYDVSLKRQGIRLISPRWSGAYQTPATDYRIQAGSERDKYQVDYEAGWVTHAQANDPVGTYLDNSITVPMDMIHAGAALASLMMTNHNLAGAGIPTSEKIGDAEKEYSASLRRGAGATAASMSLGMPDWIATKLQRYRKVQIG